MNNLNIQTIEGNLDRVLVFGGPYSNLEALQSLYDYCASCDISKEKIFCTGDVVGYCADPAASIDFVQKWGIKCILGNVEISLCDDSDDCGCNFSEGGRCDLFSRQWFPFAKSSIEPHHIDYLKGLPHIIKCTIAGKSTAIIHGGIDNISQFIFKSTDWSVKKEILDKLKVDQIIAGHCGIPFVDQINTQTWINAGVIGMPANDGTADTWFVEIGKTISHKRLQYNHLKASNKMKTLGLPQSYADTLLTGIWDNCEILPRIEASRQGQRIELI